MKGIAEHNLGFNLSQVSWGHSLDRAIGTYWHKNRRFNTAMGQIKLT